MEENDNIVGYGIMIRFGKCPIIYTDYENSEIQIGGQTYIAETQQEAQIVRQNLRELGGLERKFESSVVRFWKNIKEKDNVLGYGIMYNNKGKVKFYSPHLGLSSSHNSFRPNELNTLQASIKQTYIAETQQEAEVVMQSLSELVKDKGTEESFKEPSVVGIESLINRNI